MARRTRQHYVYVLKSVHKMCRNIVHIFVELVFLLLLSQGGNILLIVKAFNSSLIWRQKYSLYWFIHSIRETPFLGINSLCAHLDVS